MILPLMVVVWVGLFGGLALFQIYRPAGLKPKPRWLTALELPADALSGSWMQLLTISIAGLFIELLMIRWISSEITVFAYFKNFVLIACFLGFGLGAYLCRQPVNLLATFGPLTYFALLVKLPWPALRELVQKLTTLLGATTEVDVWGVPLLPWNVETVTGLGVMLLVVIPLFGMLSLIFIPIGQATARMMETAKDGILGYSVNIAGSLIGVLLYTGLCLFYQPPPVWFAVAGGLLLLGMAKTTRARAACVAVTALCVVMASLPDSNQSVREVSTQSLRETSTVFQTTGGSTMWSPYQKLRWAETRDHGELVAYQLMTNDSWYQYVVNLSDGFIESHGELFDHVPPQWNAYNMPYHFYSKSAGRAGARLGNGQRRCRRVAQRRGSRHGGGDRPDDSAAWKAAPLRASLRRPASDGGKR